MEKLKDNYDVEVHWRAFQLRPAGSPPMSPDKLAMIKRSQPMLAQRVKQDMGLELNQGPLNGNSFPALALDKYALAQGKGEEFHKAVMEAYWLQAKAIDDLEMLKGIIEELGLPADNLEGIVQDSEYSWAAKADISDAQMYGLNSVPSLVFNNKYLVPGAQPYEVLKQVVEKLQSGDIEAEEE